MSRPVPEVRMGLPPTEPWQRNLVVGLFVAYVVEIVLFRAGVPLYDWLPWRPFGAGFAPWEPLTRFLVQGADLGIVAWLVIDLLVLYFFLPAVSGAVERRALAAATVAGAVGATVLPLAFDATGLLAPTVAQGWGPLVTVLPVLYGLAAPDREILLLVFPVPGRALVWGTLVIAALYVLILPSIATLQGVGVWLGVVAWWHLLGPGARRRKLQAQARDIESELRRFQVIDGGKDKPQGRQGGGDEWVH